MGFWDIFLTEDERRKKEQKSDEDRRAWKQKSYDIIKSYGESCFLATDNARFEVKLTEKRILLTTSPFYGKTEQEVRSKYEKKEYLYKDISYISDVKESSFEIHLNNGNVVRIDFGYRRDAKQVASEAKKIIEKYSGRSMDNVFTSVQKKTSSTYVNFCWNCKENLSSLIDDRCPQCHMLICSNCGACFCNKNIKLYKK